jgi:hypothetical protein
MEVWGFWPFVTKSLAEVQGLVRGAGVIGAFVKPVALETLPLAIVREQVLLRSIETFVLLGGPVFSPWVPLPQIYSPDTDILAPEFALAFVLDVLG